MMSSEFDHQQVKTSKRKAEDAEDTVSEVVVDDKPKKEKKAKKEKTEKPAEEVKVSTQACYWHKPSMTEAG